jgi:hypothetical protein
MKNKWGDMLAIIALIVGGVAVFAKSQDYTWWSLSSWKSALVVVSVLGLVILLTNVRELIFTFTAGVFAELALWAVTITLAIGSLASETTQLEFMATAAMITLAWAAQFGRHLWVARHPLGHASAI